MYTILLLRRLRCRGWIRIAALLLTALVPNCATARADAVSPNWPPDRTHRLLVRVDPIGIGGRSSEGMVASLHLDFSRYCKDSVDLSTLLVRQYDPGTGQIIDRRINAYARTPGDLPLRFYDDQIPYDFPKNMGYANPDIGPAAQPTTLPGWGRLFNTIRDGKSGLLAWAHTQKQNQPAWYEISFRELERGAPQALPPAGFLGDGINRCAPIGDFAPVLHGRGAVGDLSGTGLTDIVVGDSAGTLLWYPNHGTPQHPRYDGCTFLRTEDGKLIDVGWSPSPDIVDWDGDGLLDLIIGVEKESILFYKNVGDRHHPVFRNMGFVKTDGKNLRIPHSPCDIDPQNKIYAVDYQPVPHAVDWKGSGKLDLLAGGYITGRIFYYENIAKSRANPPKLVYRGPLQADGKDIDVSWCAAPCTGDFRHVGKLDLITGSMPITPGGGDSADPDKFLIYYENVGTRENPLLHQVPFPVKGRFPAEACATPRAVDLCHNGLLDLVVTVEQKTFIFPNIGTPTQPLFDATVKPLASSWGNLELPPQTSSWGDTGLIPYDAPFFDINGDGFPDLFVQDHFLLKSGRGFPGIFDKVFSLPGAEQISHPILRGDPWSERAFADLDGDGKPDILFGDNDGYVWFHRNIGTQNSPAFDPKGIRLKINNGRFVQAGIPAAGAAEFDKLQGARCMIAVFHLDHSPVPDLALADTYGHIQLFLHDRAQGAAQTPHFLPPIALPEPVPHERLSVRRVDWNHDGWDDLLYAYASNDFFVLLNERAADGSRRIGAPRRLNMPMALGDPFTSVVDWNNDGDNDLIINQFGYTRLYEQSFIEHGYRPARILTSQAR